MSGLSVTVIAMALAIVGSACAGPVSMRLASARWPERAPTAALVLWQAVCLCAGLSLTGAALVAGIAPLGEHLPSALLTFWRNAFRGRPFDGLSGWRVLLLLLAAVIAGALLVVLVRCFVLTVLRRRAHRQLLDLLSTGAPADHESAAVDAEPPTRNVRVLDHDAPLAYAVPGWHTRLVLTQGIRQLLDPAQLTAVIAHERAHLNFRHALLLLPFQAWSVALGWVPGVRSARQSVAALAEMQADDAAVRTAGAGAVASAISAVALSGGGTAATARSKELPQVGSTAVVRRVRRLQQPEPLPRWALAGVYALAAALLLVPTAVLFLGWRPV